MLKINCDDCGKELTESGGLLFAPPDAAGECLNLHLCRDCFDGIYRSMLERRHPKQIAADKTPAPAPSPQRPLTTVEKWIVDTVYDIQQYSMYPDTVWKDLVMEAIKRIAER